MTNARRILALLLALVLAMGMVPFGAFATDTQCDEGCILEPGHENPCLVPCPISSCCTLSKGHEDGCQENHTFEAWNWNQEKATYFRTCQNCQKSEAQEAPAAIGELMGRLLEDKSNLSDLMTEGVNSGILTQNAADWLVKGMGTDTVSTDPVDPVDVTYIAEACGNKYTTLQDAISSVPDGSTATTVTLLGNTTEATIEIGANKNVDVNLGGNIVTGSFKVNGTATIRNGTVNGTSAAIKSTSTAVMTLEGLTVTASAYHAVRSEGGTVIVNSGSYSTTGTGTMYALRADGNAVVTINNGTFTGPGANADTAAGAISFDGQTLTINNGTFTNGKYYTLLLAGGATTINDGIFSEGVLEDSRQAVISRQGTCTIDIKGGSYTGNLLNITGNLRCVSGGTFSEDPSAHLIAGMASTNNGTNFTVMKAIAEIDDQGYATVGAALNDVISGKTVKLCGDSTEDAIDFTFKGGNSSTYTLDLNGHTLTTSAMKVTSLNSTMTITDSGTGGSIQNADGSPIMLEMTGNVTLNGCSFHTIQVSGIGNRNNCANLNLGSISGDVTIIFADDTTVLNLEGTGNPSIMLEYSGTKDGYNLGWKSGTADVTMPIVSVTESGTDYGIKWIPVQYTIGYEGMDGAAVDPALPTEYNVETTVTLANPTKSHYTFLGWTYDDVTAPQKDLTFAEGELIGNKTFLANWEAEVYSISYNLDGGTAGTNPPASHTYGTATALVAPSKAGHIFAGWFTDSSFTGTALTELAADDYTADITLWAKWTEKADWDPELKQVKVTYSGKEAAFTLEGYTIVYQQGGKEVTPVKAGSYDVVITRPEDATHKAYSHVFQNGLVIEPRELTITFLTETVAAGGKPQISYSIEGFIEGENPDTYGDAFVFPTFQFQDGTSVSADAFPKPAGAYEVFPVNASCPNYVINPQSGFIIVARYEIIKGDGQTVITSSAASFTSDAPFGLFEGVWVDGVELTSSQFYAAEGSTIVTLNADFIKTLAVGEHSLVIASTDGFAIGSFTVKAPTLYYGGYSEGSKLLQTGTAYLTSALLAVGGLTAVIAGVWFVMEKKKGKYEA